MARVLFVQPSFQPPGGDVDIDEVGRHVAPAEAIEQILKPRAHIGEAPDALAAIRIIGIDVAAA